MPELSERAEQDKAASGGAGPDDIAGPREAQNGMPDERIADRCTGMTHFLFRTEEDS